MKILIVKGNDERSLRYGKNKWLMERMQQLVFDHPELDIEIEAKTLDELLIDRDVADQFSYVVFDEYSTLPSSEKVNATIKPKKPYYRQKERW